MGVRVRPPALGSAVGAWTLWSLIATVTVNACHLAVAGPTAVREWEGSPEREWRGWMVLGWMPLVVEGMYV